MQIESHKLGSQIETTVKGDPDEVDAWVAEFLDRMYIHSPRIAWIRMVDGVKTVVLTSWTSCD